MTIEMLLSDKSPLSYMQSSNIEPSQSELTEMSQASFAVEFRHKQDFSNYCPWCDAEIEYQRLVQLVELGKQIGFALTNQPSEEMKSLFRKKKRAVDKNQINKLFYKNLPCAPQIDVAEDDNCVTVQTEGNKLLTGALVFIQVFKRCEIILKNCKISRCYFNAPQAQSIHLGGSNITEFDAEQFPELIELVLWDTNVDALSLVNNPHLQLLNISGTLLSHLDVTQNTELINLSLEDTKIAEIDLHANTGLQKLFIGNSNITCLDLTALKELFLLDINECAINTLDLHECTKLHFVYADFTLIENLDVSQCHEIEEISIRDARLAHRRNILLSSASSCKITK